MSTPTLLGTDAFKRLAEQIIAESPAEQTEVTLTSDVSALTRFAGSAIHQNVVERDSRLRVRVIVGQKTGVVSTNDLSPDRVRKLGERATEIAKRLPDDPLVVGLPTSHPVATAHSLDLATAACPPEQRAAMVAAICRPAIERGLSASGALCTEANEVAIANSRGVFAHHVSTRANLVSVVMGSSGSGYAERSASRVDDIDAEAAGAEAIETALASQNPINISPGEYPVVFQEYAVGELLAHLSYMGFGGLAFVEGRGFMAGHIDERIVDPRISIWDDGLDARGIPMPFDYEGMPRRSVDLIKNGVASGVVHDRQTASRAGASSTGHALPSPNTFGPFASHLFMAPGDTHRDDLARGIERGVWVTRLHYVNVVQPERAILTGMTRDGTFLIENGRVTSPITNLRFTQSITDAWDSLRAIGHTCTLVDAWGGVSLVPALAMNRFNFTGVSQESTE